MKTSQNNQINKISRADIAQKILRLRGQPFSLKDRPHLRFIYDYADKVWVIKAGRQVEKSTTLAAIMLTESITIPHFNCLYVTYSNKQVSDFSSDKIVPMILHSPYVRQYFHTGEVIKRVTDRTFTNGSHIFLRSAYNNPETLRGIPADRVVFDEVQNLIPEVIYVAEESLAHSKYQWKIFSGTAKTRNNLIETYWNLSKQIEYMIKCEACNYWNYQDEKIIGKDSYICAKCGNKIDIKNGRFVMLNPSGKFMGIRITQIMVPWMTFENIKEKFELKPLSYFYNEVLGLPYESMEQPVTELELRQCCSNYPMNLDFVQSIPYESIIAGIDWGMGLNSSTVVTIGHLYGNKARVLYALRLIETDAIKQYEQIRNLLSYCRASIIVTDFGAGFGLNDMLKRDFNMVIPVLYTEGGVGKVLKWDAKGKKYIALRTPLLNIVFSSIKRQDIIFPRYENIKDFLQDIMNVYVDYRTVKGREIPYYTHNIQEYDDFLHSLTYFLIGCWLYSGKQYLFTSVAEYPKEFE